jgi:hypothetical protein
MESLDRGFDGWMQDIGVRGEEGADMWPGGKWDGGG